MKEEMYRSSEKLIEELGIVRRFESDSLKEYPFNWNINLFEFQWASVMIPRGDIERIVWRACRGENFEGLNTDLKMLVQVPFLKEKDSFGIIHTNVSLTFRYDKQYKYGDVTKTLAETCFHIIQNSKKTNDYYILEADLASGFLNYYVLNSQHGLGAITATSAPVVRFGSEAKESE